MALRLLPLDDYVSDYISRSNIMKLVNDHEKEFNEYKHVITNYTNYTNQLQKLSNTINDQTKIIEHYQELNNPLSFQQWIKGIGDTKLSNDGFSETCFIPNIPGLELSENAALNRDPLYLGLHSCNDKKKWSELIEINKYERYVMINRNKCKYPRKILQYQSPSILRGNVNKINEENLWTELNNYDYITNKSSLIKLKLANLTQTIWLKCNASKNDPIYNHYVSVLPLKIRDRKRWRQQLNKYKQHKFKRNLMPNIIIFIVDSTSRSNFHRASISTDNYLETALKDDTIKYEILQFFRHSTVGWGTGRNIMGMVDGGKRMKRKFDLLEYYDKMGYIVLGMEEYLEVLHTDKDTKNNADIFVSQQWDQTMEYTFYLTNNVFTMDCVNVQYLGTEAWVNFVIDVINNVKRKYDGDLPYFMVVHMEDNHRANGYYQYVLDRYFRKLVEYLDFSNTVFHMIGDHGSQIGDETSTQFGRWEVTNPISMLWIPHNLFSDKQIERLRINQQRFVTHYDFHVFFKQIPILFTDYYGGDILEDIEWINSSLPVNHYNNIMYKNILSEIVSVNRSCDGLDGPKGYCFCHIPVNLEITEELIERDRYLIDFVIAKINMMTGNGKYDCYKLNAKDFTIITYLQYMDNNDVQLVLQQVLNKNIYNEMEIAKLKKDNKILTYFVYIEHIINKETNQTELNIPILERDGMEVPFIERLDYFKFEQCLTRKYDILSFKKEGSEFKEQFKNVHNLDEPPIIFKNMKYTESLLREQRQINLRPCKCKENK